MSADRPAATHSLDVSEADAGSRSDTFIAQQLDIPRTEAASLCKTGRVRVNDKVLSKSIKLKTADRLIIDLPAREDPLKIRVSRCAATPTGLSMTTK